MIPVTYSHRKQLAHSSSIPCVSMLTSSLTNDGGGASPLNEEKEEVRLGDGLNRSISFDTRRQVWARVEKKWARMTVDDPVILPSTLPVVKYDEDVQTLPFYQRIRSWLTRSPSSQTFQEFPIMTKVKKRTPASTVLFDGERLIGQFNSAPMDLTRHPVAFKRTPVLYDVCTPWTPTFQFCARAAG